MQVIVDLSSNGSGGADVSVEADSGLFASIFISNGIADSIRGNQFYPLDYTSAHRLYLFDDSTYFQELSLKQGSFRLRLQNTLPVGFTARIRMDEFVNKTTDQPFILDAPMNASSTVSYDYDLTQFKLIALNGLSNAATCSLRVQSTTITSLNPVTVHSTDKIRLDLISVDTPYVIKKASGVVKPIWLDIDDTVKLDIGKLSSNFSADSVLFDSIKLRLNLYSGVGHPIDFKLKIYGVNSSGGSTGIVGLVPSGSTDPQAYRLNPNVHSVIQFTNISRFVSDYVTKRGEKIIIQGTALINPYDVYATRQVGVAEDTTCLYSSLDVSIPMRVGVFKGAFSDTVEVGGNGEDKIDKDLLTKIKQATVYFKIENALPMNVKLNTTFLNDASASLMTLPKASDPAISLSAGTPSSPTVTPTPIRVSILPSDADKFNDTQNIIAKLFIDSNDQLVQFTTANYIRIRAYANIVVEIKEDK